MTVRFRNVDADPSQPVETWPAEAILIALERGGLVEWRRIAAAVRADPWGTVAQQVAEAVAHARPYGVAELMSDLIASARADAEATERAVVAAQVSELVDRSGLTKANFARRIGTSASRLSTYLAGSVVPAATLMVRMRRVAGDGSPDA
jgi:hypothetical protein